MMQGKKGRIVKVLAGAFMVSLLLLGWLSCSGENKERSQGNISLQIILPDGAAGSDINSAIRSKVENWGMIQSLEIYAYLVVDNNYSNPTQVGYAELNNPSAFPYIDLEVAVLTAVKVYFVAHAYEGIGETEGSGFVS